jgi:hypothetical protein
MPRRSRSCSLWAWVSLTPALQNQHLNDPDNCFRECAVRQKFRKRFSGNLFAPKMPKFAAKS